jgi:purine-cytosine permease-like protein
VTANTASDREAPQTAIDVKSPDKAAALFGIERRSIDYVSTSERHGTAAGQIPTWFMGQFNITTLSLGFVGPSMGLSFWWTVLAGFTGVLFGTIFMAFHATQGPIMGLPQMIQSRAQFGYRGVIVPLIAVLIDFVAYNIVTALIIMAGMEHLFGVSPVLSLIVAGVASCLLAAVGHDWIHRAARFLFFINMPLFAVISIAILAGAVHPTTGIATGFVFAGFGTQFAVAASNQIAYAPFVSDYSRYLPRDTPFGKLVAGVFLGAASSGFWLVALGGWLAINLGATDPIAGIYQSAGSLFAAFGLFAALSTVFMNLVLLSMNTYSSGLATLTVIDSLRPLRPTAAARNAAVISISILWCALTLLGGQDVVAAVSLTLSVLLYVLVPWTAVNLVDFFFVRHGHYAIVQLFRPDGIYGAWGARGLTAYAVGFVAMIPFAVLPGVYTGPVAAKLAGVDVAWIVGLLVSGVLYRLIAPDVTHEAASVRESELSLEGARD